MMKYRRAWDGDEWQTYARTLVSLRHGAPNVQPVPDHVKGDAGLEFFTTDGCAYQCYAPEEVSHTRKAANAMKSKASRDLQKLQTNSVVIERLLQKLKISRWIMLCPFLDDKDVVAFTRERAANLLSLGLPILADDFEAIVHSQDDFAEQIGFLQQQPINPANAVRIRAGNPPLEIGGGQLATQIEGKLRRAFPGQSTEEIQQLAAKFALAHADREAALSELRRDHPMLWETCITCISTEEKRLTLLGAQGAAPTDQLHSSVEKIETSMKRDLPSLAAGTISSISIGTLSDWLIRCPLDFPQRG